jgi:DNA-directed RNA polymerase specialized sigma24 family protein
MQKELCAHRRPAQANPENVESSAAESETRLTMNSALANLPDPQRKVLGWLTLTA